MDKARIALAKFFNFSFMLFCLPFYNSNLTQMILDITKQLNLYFRIDVLQSFFKNGENVENIKNKISQFLYNYDIMF